VNSLCHDLCPLTLHSHRQRRPFPPLSLPPTFLALNPPTSLSPECSCEIPLPSTQMNSTVPVFNIDEAHYSRWSYTTSYARSEPFPPPRPRSQIVPPSPPTPSLPPAPKARPAIQISPGVWVENQDILYSSEYPPVQKYLKETREQRTFLRPPSEVILALAALDVAEHPDDPAHWIIWNIAYFNDIQERVDKVFCAYIFPIIYARPNSFQPQRQWNNPNELRPVYLGWGNRTGQLLFLANSNTNVSTYSVDGTQLRLAKKPLLLQTTAGQLAAQGPTRRVTSPPRNTSTWFRINHI